MTTYKLKVTGSLDNVTNALVAVLEDQNSQLNISHPELSFDELNWTTEKLGMSSAIGVFNVNGIVSKTDLNIFRDEYDVAVALRKVEQGND